MIPITDPIARLLAEKAILTDALNKYTQNPTYWPTECKTYPAKWAEEALKKVSQKHHRVVNVHAIGPDKTDQYWQCSNEPVESNVQTYRGTLIVWAKEGV